ncbi:MAG: diguanylate cyclase, partial [Desulfobacterales bacterium]|nr:diguanylate cyclase [Desulfobacterales bacterium]
YLVRAEGWRIRPDEGQSRELYDKAVSLAQANGMVNEVALANELAGRYYLGRDFFQQARLYLNNALISYEQWGAKTKVNQITSTYAHLLLPEAPVGMPLDASTTGREINDLIDFESLLDSFTAISKEIVLENLLRTLMEIVLVNGGADKGLFISVSDDDYRVESLHVLDGGRIKHPDSGAMGTYSLPDSILRYVLRSKERVMINRFPSDSPFAGDPYFEQHPPKSLLCMPIVRQSRITGMLYLENSLAFDVFSERRIRMLDMLSVQIAISLENARIHKHLEDMVAVRTRTLNEKNRELESITGELRRVNQTLKKLASEDPLTGLFNRRQIFEAGDRLIKDAVRARVPVSVFMLDIDFFKPFNDTYGHQAGDRCLRRVGQAISRIFQRSNDLVGRYGGEEFAGILFDVNRDAMGAAVLRLSAKIASLAIPHQTSDISDMITASIGYTTVVPSQGTDLDDLIKTADNALYQAKDRGRNQSVYLRHT